MTARLLGPALACSLFGLPAAPAAPAENPTAGRYLELIESFAGWAEAHWNEREECYDAKGSGVSWARGNGDVCLVQALLLTERPDRAHFSSRQVPRAAMLDHLRRTIRTLCRKNKNCAGPLAIRPPAWGGPDWQSALETSRWLWASHLLGDQLDGETRALVRQVATAEAEAARKEIPAGKPGNTAGDDCVWNAALLGAAASFFDDAPRAGSWDEWGKRWALSAEGRDADRQSRQMVDGKPLAEWLTAANVYPDFTLENHGFWSVPYQAQCEELSVAALAYRARGKKIPEALSLHAREDGEVLRWLALVDGDLLCPEGQDWAPRDIQHNWCFAWLGTVHDFGWARAAERRGLAGVAARQAAFGDGSLHALDFGYETDLAVNWCFSYLLHKYFGKAAVEPEVPELTGSRVFPHVKAAVFRTGPLVSSVAWHDKRPAVMIVPNDAAALGNHPSFTSYDPSSGLGWIKLEGQSKPGGFRIAGPPRIEEERGRLLVTFTREFRGAARQRIGYCALPTGEVLVFSDWRALNDLQVAELVDHPFYCVEVPGYLPARPVIERGPGTWSIDGKLQVQVLGGAGGKVQKAALLGSVRDQRWSAREGEVLASTVCIYQAESPGRKAAIATGTARKVTLGEWTVEQVDDGRLQVLGGQGKDR